LISVKTKAITAAKTNAKNCQLSAPRMPVCSIPALSFLTPLQWPPLGLKLPSRALPADDVQAWLRWRLRSKPRLLLLGGSVASHGMVARESAC